MPVDVVGLGILLTLILARLLPADKAFAGLDSYAVMLILTAVLVRTGTVDQVRRAFQRRKIGYLMAPRAGNSG